MANVKYLNEAGLRRVSEYVNAKLTFASSMPESPIDNQLVMYVGETTSDYTKGGVYQYNNILGAWELINFTQPIILTYEEFLELPQSIQESGHFIVEDYPGVDGGGTIEGYYNSTDGKFYADDQYITEIPGEAEVLYVGLNNDTIYRYDETEDEFIAVGGGSGVAIKYVNVLPVTGVEDIIYGIKGYNSFEETIADGFLDENVLFDKEDDLSGGYIYTPAEDVVLDASDDGVTYKGFTSLTYDGISDWTLTFDDATDATLADGDTFYFRQLVDKFFAGDAANQKVIPFASSGESGEISYTAGDGIKIENHEISVTEDRPATFVGTTQEWDALTAAEKAQYKVVNLTNDAVGGDMVVVDTIEDGNLNPCTSNSVYQAIAEKNKLITILAENSDIDISTTRYQTTISGLSNLLSIYVRGYIGTNSGGNRFCAIIPVPIALGNFDYQIAIESSNIHDISLIVNLTSAGVLQIGCTNRQSNKVALTFIKGVKI